MSATHTMAATMGAVPGGGDDDRRWPAAALLALLVEAALLGGAAWMIGRAHAPQPLAPVQIVLEAPKPAPKPQAPPVVKPPPPKPRPRPHPVAQHRPRPTPTPQQPRIVAPPAPAPQTHPAMPVQPPPPPPPPPPRPAVPDAATVQADFAARLRSAIQSAVRYPRAAQMMQLQGNALVAFTWLDGSVSALSIVHSSGSSMLDAAALAAVRDAFMPPTPLALRGRVLTFSIRVRFHLDDS
jgi:protein TonB